MKKILLIVLAILLVLVIGVFAVLSYFGSDMTIDSDTEVIIDEGQGTSAIGATLEEAGLIKDSRYFRYFAKFNNIDGQFKAGTYNFTAGDWTVGAVSEMIVLGIFSTTGDAQVTIVEGLSVKQIAQMLSEAGLGEVDAYLQYAAEGDFSEYDFIPAKGSEIEPATRLEGFLFPDTYMLDPAWSEEQIIDMLLAQFAHIWQSNGYDELAAASGQSIYEIITMASVVEKEAQVSEDRPLIAGVFYKRIDMGMKLESCATVQFILGEAKEDLLFSDISIDNLYNTYENPGLPPGPIAAPGKASIEAALNPTNSDYLYFRAKTDGSHRFSVTFVEHTNRQDDDQ